LDALVENLYYTSPVLVQLDSSDNDIAGMHADRRGRSVGLVALNTVDMDDPFFAVNLRNFSLTSFVFAPDNTNFIVFANRE
jgi:hypothetical protein